MRHAWFPSSPCGPGCLTGDEPRVGALRRSWRLTALILVVLGALLTVPALPVAGRRGRKWLVRTVFRLVLRAAGVRLRVRGGARLHAGGRGVLVVNNHTSWLDIVAVNAVRPMRALAKRDIGRWPVIGGLASAAGTIYVHREGLRSLPETVARLAETLRAGALVNVTPEGTTWCGLTHGRFRPAMFQAAIDGGVPVLPVALRFRVSGRPTTAAAFIGDESIVDSVRRVVASRGLELEMHVLEELAPGRAADRRELAALAEAAVAPVIHWTSTTLEVAAWPGDAGNQRHARGKAGFAVERHVPNRNRRHDHAGDHRRLRASRGDHGDAEHGHRPAR